MLDIDNIFDKILTLIQEFPVCPSSDMLDENPHCSFSSSSSDVYCTPSPCDFTSEPLDNSKDSDKNYPIGDLQYFVPENLLHLRKKLKTAAWNY